METKCPTITKALEAQRFEVYPELEKHGNKQDAVKSYGDYEEEPWTAMNLDGAECTSVGVHVVGVMVGYCGYSNNPTTLSRAKHVIDTLELTPHMLPALIRAAKPGSEVRQPLSKPEPEE